MLAAYTFGIAAKRAADELVLRVDDLDSGRCTDEYTEDAIDDLRWLGLAWAEGLIVVANHKAASRVKEGSYHAWQELAAKIIYPSPHSRRM